MDSVSSGTNDEPVEQGLTTLLGCKRTTQPRSTDVTGTKTDTIMRATSRGLLKETQGLTSGCCEVCVAVSSYFASCRVYDRLTYF